MPWKRRGRGYTKRGKGRGGYIRNPAMYYALRRKGYSKERAAAITNARNR